MTNLTKIASLPGSGSGCMAALPAEVGKARDARDAIPTGFTFDGKTTFFRPGQRVTLAWGDGERREYLIPGREADMLDTSETVTHRISGPWTPETRTPEGQAERIAKLMKFHNRNA